MSDQLYENVNSDKNAISLQYHGEVYINNNVCSPCKPCDMINYEAFGITSLVMIAGFGMTMAGIYTASLRYHFVPDQLYENVNSNEDTISWQDNEQSYINNNDCPPCKPCDMIDHEGFEIASLVMTAGVVGIRIIDICIKSLHYHEFFENFIDT